MLASIVLGATILQQDNRAVQMKWDEVRAVWDGYAGVTGEMGFGPEKQKFALLRDGRYLVRTVATVNGQEKTILVESFDGFQTTTYDGESRRYIVTVDQEPPTWVEPFQMLWGVSFSGHGINSTQERLYAYPDAGASMGFTGFVLAFGYVGGGALTLRSRDMCPLLEITISDAFGTTVDIERYPVCKPILYKRHCDREIEWSLPPGARLVEHLERDR